MRSVEVHLASHAESDWVSTEKSIGFINQALLSSNDRVCVMLEDSNTTTNEASTMEGLIASGVLPSIALATKGKLPMLNDWAIKLLNTAIGSLPIEAFGDTRNCRLFFALDALYRQHKDSEGKSRLLILFEGSLDKRPQLTAHFVENQLKIRGLFMDCDFDRALALFKKNVDNMAREVRVREGVVLEKIKSSLADRDIFAVFLLFGAQHISLYHELKRSNPGSVRRRFLDKEEDNKYLWFDPTSSAITKVFFKGYDSLTEIEWNQALLGSIVLTLIQFMNESSETQMSWNDMVDITIKAVKRFTTMQDFKLFQEKAKQSGVIDAFESLN